MKDDVEKPAETEIERSLRMYRNGILWRQWALNEALLRGRSGSLLDTFQEAEQILAWLIKTHD